MYQIEMLSQLETDQPTHWPTAWIDRVVFATKTNKLISVKTMRENKSLHEEFSAYSLKRFTTPIIDSPLISNLKDKENGQEEKWWVFMSECNVLF